jgi:DNA-binding NtrC family response regulator
LYHCLEPCILKVPALSERRGDIEQLLRISLAKHAHIQGKRRVFSPAALRLLTEYSWPGDVVELDSTVAAAVSSSGKEMISVADLPRRLTEDAGMETGQGDDAPAAPDAMERPRPVPVDGEIEPLRRFVARVEREYVAQVLAECNGRKDLAARRLGVAPSTLYRKLGNED